MKGKWALVTGATAGLGLAVAEGLAGAGANIVLHDLVAPKQPADDLRARFGVEVIAAGVDLSQREAIEATMADLLDRCGAIEILVNNAVVRHFSAIEQFPLEKWDQALAVNLTAPFHLIRLALPGMKQRSWGRIINMGSIYSSRAVEDRIDYVTTKTAILGMTRSVAIEMARSGITCNTLCPGTLPTPAILNKIAAIAGNSGHSIDHVTREYLGERQPTQRFVEMNAVAAMVVFLCGPAANDITGASLPIDGGWSVA
ncbi:SDR family oxidoreductase [Bradyrhizobium betae]|uniref:Beta-D-hydroxybutyrate dehydrogenase n=1 Tax=Bradyrhizobium betae TaxID=244734 RepID=A0A4Q1VU84_9BRAD|nr:SDR family oxidoreductase [Bradyrhizobium betae]RXT54314.1 beta-D-hydroxybutyrate dehydrogenase [Bradyrhizobium betae]